LDVWLKIDTGMGRLGISPDEVSVALTRLKALAPGVRSIRLMTHFANADRPDDPATHEQLARFGHVIGEWTGDVSLANSAAIMRWPSCAKPSSQLRYAGENWVRPGLMLYGVAPVAPDPHARYTLRPAMSFETQVLAVKTIARGRPVGYGGDWRAARDTRLGIIAVGYGDGYPWQKTVATSVQIGRRKVPLVGRISMDLVTVDLTDAPEAGVGARVVLWGGEPSVSEVARLAGRIPYELLCGVSARVPRQLVDA
jgi:alanine racemase